MVDRIVQAARVIVISEGFFAHGVVTEVGVTKFKVEFSNKTAMTFFFDTEYQNWFVGGIGWGRCLCTLLPDSEQGD